MGFSIFKFGGASVKSDESIRGVGQIVKNKVDLIIVVSAMGKTTNQLEGVLKAFYAKGNFNEHLSAIKNYHLNIISQLFGNVNNEVGESCEKVFAYIDKYLLHAEGLSKDEVYDQIIPAGELLSSKILSAYLNSVGFENQWLDARKLLLTDNYYGRAHIKWKESEALIQEQCVLPKNYVIQGFIGGGENNKMTTLGREGSDYTAGILANMLNAESLTVWKDVPGVLNADPRYFNNPIKLDRISYREAVELAYYGATIIHPDTIKPLQNKNIPLWVKSFNHPNEKGTLISSDGELDSAKPIYIFKPNQVLISLSPKDFSYINEEQLSRIFKILHDFKMDVNSMQNSAINFSFCTDLNQEKLDKAISEFGKLYRVFYNTNLELLTVRHYIYEQVVQLVAHKEVLLEQKTRSTIKFVLRSNTE
ncbi:MAG: aspartate kinase [Flavobacteriales bacterium]|nr:aspartate kinase [Flavobacteriales bacterium]